MTSRMRRFRWWLAAHLVMLGNDLTKPETGEDPIWFVEWTLAYMKAYTKSSIKDEDEEIAEAWRKRNDWNDLSLDEIRELDHRRRKR